jgi:hypothetical protein
VFKEVDGKYYKYMFTNEWTEHYLNEDFIEKPLTEILNSYSEGSRYYKLNLIKSFKDEFYKELLEDECST